MAMIIGRKNEQQQLERLLHSKEAEFMVEEEWEKLF